MKYLVIILTFATLLLGIDFEANAQSKKSKKSKNKDKYTIQVDGLGCPFCAYGLEKKFKEFKGIKNVAIDMETGVFTFTYPAEKALSVERVEKQVDEAGYTPVSTKIERTDGTVETSKQAPKVETVLTEESEIESEELFVAGKCDMCQKRIEKTAKGILGVTEAAWDKTSQTLTVSFDNTQVSAKGIAAAIADKGHDTSSQKATDEAYDKLPMCCQYDRTAAAE